MKTYTISFYGCSGTWSVNIKANNEDDAINKALLVPNANNATKHDLKSIIEI